jgi:phage shock protein E
MKHSPDFLAMAQEARKRIKEIAPDKVKTLMQSGAVVIDVRDRDEFESGHIAGATNVSRGTLEMHIAGVVPDKNTPVVCYCAGGNRGALATDTLVKMGYTNAFSIAGGLNAFKAHEEK